MEGIINLTCIDILLISTLIILIFNLIILDVSLKNLVNMLARKQALENFIKANHRDNQIQRNLKKNKFQE